MVPGDSEVTSVILGLLMIDNKCHHLEHVKPHGHIVVGPETQQSKRTLHLKAGITQTYH